MTSTAARTDAAASAYGDGATSLLERVGSTTSYIPWERESTIPALGSPFSPFDPFRSSDRGSSPPSVQPPSMSSGERGELPAGSESAPREWVMEQYISFVCRATAVRLIVLMCRVV